MWTVVAVKSRSCESSRCELSGMNCRTVNCRVVNGRDTNTHKTWQDGQRLSSPQEVLGSLRPEPSNIGGRSGEGESEGIFSSEKARERSDMKRF